VDKRFVVRADEKWTAFLELGRVTHEWAAGGAAARLGTTDNKEQFLATNAVSLQSDSASASLQLAESGLLLRIFRPKRRDDFLEARVAAQRVPKWQ
jgi:hypothetical protein